MASERLRIGFIGCGNFANNFSTYWLEQATIVALCDVAVEKTAALAKLRNLTVRHYTDYREMLSDGNLDAVVITAANFVHRDITVAAAEAGVHVFCEKAMARTTAECWDMVHACQVKNVKLMIGHKRRLRPPWARMIELTNNEWLGQPFSITIAQYADRRSSKYFDTWYGDPKLSGGSLHLFGVHVVDWSRAMCGEARAVSAFAGPQHDDRYKYPDILHTTIQFRSEALVSICGGMNYPLHQFRESQGPWGECEHGGFKLVPHLNHIDLYWQRLDESQPHHERFDDLGFDHAYRKEISAFIAWVTRDQQPCLTWVEGLRCVEIMEAAYLSAEQEGQPVDLPLLPDRELETTGARANCDSK